MKQTKQQCTLLLLEPKGSKAKLGSVQMRQKPKRQRSGWLSNLDHLAKAANSSVSHTIIWGDGGSTWFTLKRAAT